jgi:hypothetical protein
LEQPPNVPFRNTSCVIRDAVPEPEERHPNGSAAFCNATAVGGRPSWQAGKEKPR